MLISKPFYSFNNSLIFKQADNPLIIFSAEYRTESQVFEWKK